MPNDTHLILGGGMTVAAALAGSGNRVFPPDLTRCLSDSHRQKGDEVLAGALLAGIETREGLVRGVLL